MTDPIPYEWNFDRTSRDSGHPDGIFSVGIYQWLPKSSAKGLKKSKTIRVQGYVAEAERVYEKAMELCAKLNAEGVRADKPPAWVQKTYSLPKPPDVEKGRFSFGLTGAQCRAIRLKVMKGILHTAGFVKGDGGAYLRQIKDQIHLIDFQPNSYGGTFTVNLGYQYTFLPSAYPFAIRQPDEYRSVVDFGLRTRLGHVWKGGDTW